MARGVRRRSAVALHELPEPQRSVIEMRVLEGRPYDEVARSLEIRPRRGPRPGTIAASPPSACPSMLRANPGFPLSRWRPPFSPKETNR